MNIKIADLVGQVCNLSKKQVGQVCNLSKALAVLLTAAIATITASASAAAPVDSEFREKLRWRPAPTVTIAVDRSYLLKGSALEQIVAEGQKSPAKAADRPAARSRTVVEGELIPLRYRRTIHHYFLLIRPTAQP